MPGTGTAGGSCTREGLICPLRSLFSSGVQLDPTATIASLSISDWRDVCLEVPRVLLVVNALDQLAHLPVHAYARLAFFWGVDCRTAPRSKVISGFRPPILVVETPVDGALWRLLTRLSLFGPLRYWLHAAVPRGPNTSLRHLALRQRRMGIHWQDKGTKG